MKEYVPPEMEIDLFEDNCGLLTATSCANAGCTIHFAHGDGEDPFDSFTWWS